VEPTICQECNQPISVEELADGNPKVAYGPDGPMHGRCAKLAKMHGREVSREEIERALHGVDANESGSNEQGGED